VSYPKIMDAAVPPATSPAGIEGVMGYIGGARATRVWTTADWLRFQHLAQFPLYVPDLTASAVPQAINAVDLAKNRGWAAFMPEPGRRVIGFDLETGINRAWYAAAAAIVIEEGFVPFAYGSLSTVLENAAEIVVAADWIGGSVIPQIPPGQTIEGLQWEANVAVGDTMVDYSVFTPALFARGGVGARHG
jgi:hypothetical protein